jgi:hypothetical protein
MVNSHGCFAGFQPASNLCHRLQPVGRWQSNQLPQAGFSRLLPRAPRAMPTARRGHGFHDDLLGNAASFNFRKLKLRANTRTNLAQRRDTTGFHVGDAFADRFMRLLEFERFDCAFRVIVHEDWAPFYADRFLLFGV